jgi:type IV pilus assembly protein PilE
MPTNGVLAPTSGSKALGQQRDAEDNRPMPLRPAYRTRISGLTLIELMVVLAIVGVLAAVAYPSYQSAVQRSRRADAMSALNRIMQAQERWRANNPAYKATLTDPDLPGAAQLISPDNHYDLTLANVTRSTYTALATVHSGSPQAADTHCQVLRVAVNNGNIVYSSLANGGGANGNPDPCWSK